MNFSTDRKASLLHFHPNKGPQFKATDGLPRAQIARIERTSANSGVKLVLDAFVSSATGTLPIDERIAQLKDQQAELESKNTGNIRKRVLGVMLNGRRWPSND